MSLQSTGEDRNIYLFDNSGYQILWRIQGRKGHSFYNQRAQKGSEANIMVEMQWSKKGMLEYNLSGLSCCVLKYSLILEEEALSD